MPRSFPSHYQTPSLIPYEVRVHGERDTYSDYIEYLLNYSNLPCVAGDSNVGEDLSRIVIGLCGLLAMARSIRKRALIYRYYL